jgi:type II secretory pathway pseudopilin PulG
MTVSNRSTRHARAQRGATLVVALIMLTLITLVVVSAFTLSSSNLKAVGNMQARDESIAAANQAIELVVSSSFTDLPVAQEVNVDINKDGTTDYTVAIAVPKCVKAIEVPNPDKCDETLKALCAENNWYTNWDLQATVGDAASGASAVVHQGVRVKLTNSQKTAVCSTPAT